MDVKTLSTSCSSIWIIQYLVLRHYNLFIFCFLPSSFFMSFISKKPSAVPRVLCASLCPPRNILHDIDDYASFYDPCYYPHLHTSVFAKRESTCAWLLSGLQTHSLTCERHLQTFSHVVVTTDDTSSSPVHFFHFFMDGVHLCVPFADIESSSFSFCRLQCLHDLLLSNSVVPARLGLKAPALAWPEPALAFSNPRPSQNRQTRLGSGLAWPRPRLYIVCMLYIYY